MAINLMITKMGTHKYRDTEIGIFMTLKPKVLLEGLAFPEGPRWHDGKLWFSDMQSLHVMTLDMEGNTEKIVEVQCSPSNRIFVSCGII